MTGISPHFVQSNQSKSSFGVLVGLHFRKGDAAQAKLVRVLSGEVLDVVLDLRKHFKAYGQYISVLSREEKSQLFIPRGFAQGFVVSSDTVELYYLCDNLYSPKDEGGEINNDSSLNFDLKLPFT